MARIRSIKPEFWTSEQVMSCSPMARLLFIGMWNFADDYGRMPFSPATIKAQVLPGDSIPVDEIRQVILSLCEAGLIFIYSANGREYLEITGWFHQKIDKPHKPKHPAPFVEPSENLVEASPNVPLTFSAGEERIREERKKEKETVGVDFEKFWSEYPKRGAANPRKPAADKFMRLVRDGIEPQKIISGATVYAGECERLKIINTDKVAQAITWLNQERWNDYISEKTPEQEAVINLDMAKRGYEWRDGKWEKTEATA